MRGIKFEVMRPFVLSFFVLFAVGLYFRTNKVYRHLTYSPEKAQSQVEGDLERWLEAQVLDSIKKKYPDMPPAQMREMVPQEASKIRRYKPDQYERRKREIHADVPGNPGVSRYYLLGRDSYSYYDLTRRIQDTGNVADSFRRGQYLHPLRGSPHGTWENINFHPYVGSLWHNLIKSVYPSVDLMTSVSSLPLFLSLLGLVAFFLAAEALKLEWQHSFFGGLGLILAPLYIRRSMYGWYDTDPYNIIFPMLLLVCLFKGMRRPKAGLGWGLLAALLTLLYRYFWVGWSVVFFMILGAGGVAAFLTLFRKKNAPRGALSFCVTYGILTLGLFALLTSPERLLNLLSGVLFWGGQFMSREISLWPNVFMTVDETKSLSLELMVANASSWPLIVLAVVGCFDVVRLFFKKNEEFEWGPWVAGLVLFAGLFFASLKLFRFILLFIIPLAFMVSRGAMVVLERLQCSRMARRLKGGKYKKFVTTACVGILLILVGPFQIYAGTQALVRNSQLMNDAMYDLLGRIRTETTEDSVVMGWWPFGYEILALAERGVFVDGGSQQSPETYWTARFYLAEDEREALGILRMLNTDGNGAVELLESEGWRLPDAIGLVSKVLPQSKASARRLLPESMKESLKETLLSKTHGSEMPPTYVVVSYDLIRKNSAMAIMARWDFEKASSILDAKRDKKTSVAHPFSASSVLKHEIATSVANRKNNTLQFYNGLEVNLDTYKAQYRDKTGKVTAEPDGLYFVAEGEFKVIPASGSKILDVAALLFDQDEVPKVVLAQPEFVRSMLARFYYLKGSAMKHFRLAGQKQNPVTGESYLLFEALGSSLDI